MPLKSDFSSSVAAAFTGIWVRSYEHVDAMATISETCGEYGWTVLTWDAEVGTRADPATLQTMKVDEKDKTPMQAIKALRSILIKKEDQRHAILVMRNLHIMLAQDGKIINPVLLQMLQRTMEAGEEAGHHVLILSTAGVIIPDEIKKQFRIIDHDLPGRDEILAIYMAIEESENLPDWESNEGKLLLDAAAGMTRAEITGAASLSLVDKGKLDPETIWQVKADNLKRQGALTIEKPTYGFEKIGGFNVLKNFWMQGFTSQSKQARPRAAILFGVPGAGKDTIVRALAKEIRRPLLNFDLGATKGKFVGESERQMREALANAEQMAPCILKVSELEKFMAGGSGSHDSGVGAAQLGYLLNWLQDHEEDVYFVGTVNDISLLSQVSGGAFLRAERFDGVFFVDLPSPEQLDQIWNIWLSHYTELSDAQKAQRPNADSWTGAEIKHCCKMAAMMKITLTEAADQYVIPVAVTAKEQIVTMREFADNRCLSTDYMGRYRKDAANRQFVSSMAAGDPKRRRVIRAAKV